MSEYSSVLAIEGVFILFLLRTELLRELADIAQEGVDGVVVCRCTSDSLWQQPKGFSGSIPVDLLSAKARIVEGGVVPGVVVWTDRSFDEWQLVEFAAVRGLHNRLLVLLVLQDAGTSTRARLFGLTRRLVSSD
jgi:hypothetical protein